MSTFLRFDVSRSKKGLTRAAGSRAGWIRFDNAEVASAFERYPEAIRKKMMHLRQLIFETAAATEGVGELEEALRWGEPSYLTTKSKSGSIIRIDSKDPGQYAMYFHCQTGLIAKFKSLYPDEFEYIGGRCITFDQNEKVPVRDLCHCISLALTYHLDKKKRRPAKNRGAA